MTNFLWTKFGNTIATNTGPIFGHLWHRMQESNRTPSLSNVFHKNRVSILYQCCNNTGSHYWQTMLANYRKQSLIQYRLPFLFQYWQPILVQYWINIGSKYWFPILGLYWFPVLTQYWWPIHILISAPNIEWILDHQWQTFVKNVGNTIETNTYLIFWNSWESI